MTKILLTGGSGLLGQCLLKLDPAIVAPKRSELDIQDGQAIVEQIRRHKPDMVIHAAAVTDNRYVEKVSKKAVKTNIIGTANVALACLQENVRLVYISADYVYKGDRGNYKESDEILPFNLYAWTKLGGECAVRACPNYLIIRTSFGGNIFPYPVAFLDKWTSKDTVDVLGPMILEAALSPITGVLNLGTERKTIYEYAKALKGAAQPVMRNDTAFFTPMDTSLDISKWRLYKSESGQVQRLENCRICGSSNLTRYLDLGVVPLANNLVRPGIDVRQQPRFPLQVLKCGSCSLSQLSVVVSPKILYSHYVYRSSISRPFDIHCNQLAQAAIERFSLKQGDLAVDIASNDGVLLRKFRDHGLEPLGIEPAANLAGIANAEHLETINAFWSIDTAQKVLETHGRPKLITATNVFAHVGDVHAFLKAIDACLDEDGVLILEFPYLVDLINGNEFDTIYHEHLSYFLLGPLKRLFDDSGAFCLLHAERTSIHGGSIRITVGKTSGQHVADVKGIEALIEAERRDGLLDLNRYVWWSKEIERIKDHLGVQLYDLRRSGATIAAFGASAKGNTLLNSAGITTDLVSYIVDETPEKLGMLSPGTGIPIVDPSWLHTRPPTYLLILAWNFKEEIYRKTSQFRNQGGKYIIPVPEFQVI